jgi:8-oxo-dGTP diphosphatase
VRSAFRTVIVAAGVLVEGGRALLTRRKAGSHLAGLWEMPGGKVEEGEDPKDALVRELREEIGVEVAVGSSVCVTFHRYEDAQKAVLLLFYEVTRVAGSPEPRALDVAELRWASAEDLDGLDFPPADVEVIDLVRTRLSRGARAG